MVLDEDSWLTFPDEPRVELDRVLGELVDRARDVVKTQGRLRALLRANLAIVQQLDLSTVLQRIVDAAVELFDAQYAALGVVAPHGGLEQFIHSGMSQADVDAIGHLPEGHGLLGALIDDPRPIRLDHLSADPRSAGFPAGHPPMQSFLGVPVRVRDEVYGNLYLSNRMSGNFTAEDEQLAVALAATAGFAIDNARLFAETKTRQAWSAASADISTALLTGDQSDLLSLLASRVLALSTADFVCILQPGDEPDQLVVRSVEGFDGATTTGAVVEGDVIARTGSIAGSVLAARQPRLVDETAERSGAPVETQRLGPMMLVPLLASDLDLGVLIVAREKHGNPFTRAELEMVADFTGHASIAIELANARADRQRVLLLEDRARIARDLHDHVIQQLFATGLGLQSVAATLPSGAAAAQVEQSIDNVDAAITQIRTAIFAISGVPTEDGATTRSAIIDIVNELSPLFARTPQISFVGPVDLLVTDALADDVLAVVREALTNVARHASARTVSLRLSVDEQTVEIEVTDDGVGIPESGRRSGLANLQQRAVNYGGSFTFGSESGVTRVTWTVPYPRSGEGRP
jgi:signal transduction histidine kinase